MKISIDTDRGLLSVDGRDLALYTDESFELLSELWTRVGWNQKYSYTFTWLGVPIIQLPEDVMRFQEAVVRIRPDVIIETGIAHGGSAILSASLCTLLGKGRVIAIDIDLRPANRARIERHPLAGLISLLDGSSTDPSVVARVREQIDPADCVLAVLDSNHSYSHVTEELKAYAPMVSVGSYIIATDGIMQDLTRTPRGMDSWGQDNPAAAARDFVSANPNFAIVTPEWPFNESTLTKNITHWPNAWIKRLA